MSRLDALKRRLALRLATAMAFYGWQDPIATARTSGARIGQGVALWDTVLDAVYPWLITIEDDCTITGAQILCHDDSAVLFSGDRYVAPVHIRDHVFIGRGAVVLPGVMIGPRAVVGAGAIVTRDVPPDCVVVGQPARILGSVDEMLARKRGTPRRLRLELGTNLPGGDVEARLQGLVRTAFAAHVASADPARMMRR